MENDKLKNLGNKLMTLSTFHDDWLDESNELKELINKHKITSQGFILGGLWVKTWYMHLRQNLSKMVKIIYDKDFLVCKMNVTCLPGQVKLMILS